MKKIATTFALIAALALSACGKDESAAEIAAANNGVYTEQADGSFTGVENDIITDEDLQATADAQAFADAQAAVAEADEILRNQAAQVETGRIICQAAPYSHVYGNNPKPETAGIVAWGVGDNRDAACRQASNYCANMIHDRLLSIKRVDIFEGCVIVGTEPEYE